MCLAAGCDKLGTEVFRRQLLTMATAGKTSHQVMLPSVILRYAILCNGTLCCVSAPAAYEARLRIR
jgi:hypothetical protein